MAPRTDSNRGANMSWITTGIFTVAAMMGLWWAQNLQESIRDQMTSTAEQPIGPWIVWSLIIVVVGLCIGLAVASGSGWRARIPISALLWAAVPLAVVVSFHLFLTGWVVFPFDFTRLIVGIQMQVASAMAVGIFLSGLLSPLLPRSPRREAAGG